MSGENSQIKGIDNLQKGSSPRERGKLADFKVKPLGQRLIPA